MSRAEGGDQGTKSRARKREQSAGIRVQWAERTESRVKSTLSSALTRTMAAGVSGGMIELCLWLLTWYWPFAAVYRCLLCTRFLP